MRSGSLGLTDAASANPAYVSPSDAIMTPCTAKLSQAKKKHFTKYVPSRPPPFPVLQRALTTRATHRGKPIRFAFNKATPEEDESAPEPDAAQTQTQSSSPLAQTTHDIQEDPEEEDKMDVEPTPGPTSRLEPAEF